MPERDLNNANAYPEITADDLPYGEGKTVVIDAEIDPIGDEGENITTITKQVPPEPTDETFKLAKGETLIDALTDRGVSTEAAKALVKAIEPVFPPGMMKAGTTFELTLDRQLDFYGREVTFPVELSFEPGPKETLTVEADEDGRFVAADRRRQGRHQVEIRGVQSLPHQGQGRLQPLRHRQGQQDSRLHHRRADPRLRL